MLSMVKTVKIADREINYRVINRRVKYPRLEFKTGGLVIILPEAATHDEQLVSKYRSWIANKSDAINRAIASAAKKKLVLHRSPRDFSVMVDRLISEHAKTLNVNPGKVFVRAMRSKWASLSSRRNLTLNSYLRQLPADLVSYVIYHELCHLIERRHNARFWALVGRKYCSHNKLESLLLEYWFLITDCARE